MPVLSDLRTGLWHLRSGGPAQVREWRIRRRAELGFADPANTRGIEAGWIGRGSGRRLSFPAAAPAARPPRRTDLTVGVILDEFSAQAFALRMEHHRPGPSLLAAPSWNKPKSTWSLSNRPGRATGASGAGRSPARPARRSRWRHSWHTAGNTGFPASSGTRKTLRTTTTSCRPPDCSTSSSPPTNAG